MGLSTLAGTALCSRPGIPGRAYGACCSAFDEPQAEWRNTTKVNPALEAMKAGFHLRGRFGAHGGS